MADLAVSVFFCRFSNRLEIIHMHGRYVSKDVHQEAVLTPKGVGPLTLIGR
jgi:hypothetical protein